MAISKKLKLLVPTVFIVSVLVLSGLIISRPIGTVSAAESDYNYLQVSGNSAVFEVEGGSARFIIPPTYFVELVSVEASAYIVKYNDLSGSVSKTYEGSFKHTDGKLDKFKKSDSGAKSYYEATLLPGSGSSLDIRQKAEFSADKKELWNPVLKYYGYETTNGPGGAIVFYYVGLVSHETSGIDFSFGYVDASYTNRTNLHETVPQNSDAAKFERLDQSSTGDPIGGGDDGEGDKPPVTNTVRIVLIVMICLLAVLIIFIIFKPVKRRGRYQIENKPRKRGRDKYEYDDDDDF